MSINMNNMKDEILLQTSDTDNNLPEEINHASDSDYNNGIKNQLHI